MRSMVSVARHPIHPMLVPLPIGLWLFSLACDVMTLYTGGAVWWIVSGYAMAGGTLGAVAAAGPGFVDLFSMKPSRVKRLGIWHMSINSLLLLLYVVNFLWRRSLGGPAVGPIVLAGVSIALLTVSGWLGGEMVYVHGVGVDPVPEEGVKKGECS